jgi:hypothetical protein
MTDAQIREIIAEALISTGLQLVVVTVLVQPDHDRAAAEIERVAATLRARLPALGLTEAEALDWSIGAGMTLYQQWLLRHDPPQGSA